MTAPEGSLRQRHTERTRRQIVDIALELFAERGIDETTVDEIAAAADVSPRTFYRYFPSKEAVLFHSIEERLDEMRRLIAERPADEPPFETLVAALRHAVDTMANDPRRRSLLQRLVAERPQLRTYQRNTIIEHTERQILGALAPRAGIDPGDLGLRSVVAAVTACFDLALRTWIEQGAAGSFDDYFTTTLDACASSFTSVGHPRPTRRR